MSRSPATRASASADRPICTPRPTASRFLRRALRAGEASGIPAMVIGGGTNLIVSDRGFRGIVLRYRGDALLAEGNRVTADAGAELQRPGGFHHRRAD